MEEKIIPEKEPLFQQKRQLKPSQRVKPAAKREKPTPDDKPVFDIPQIQLQAPQMQQPVLTEPTGQAMPEKKPGWRKWVVIAAVILIVIGLGYYFLRG